MQLLQHFPQCYYKFLMVCICCSTASIRWVWQMLTFLKIEKLSSIFCGFNCFQLPFLLLIFSSLSADSDYKTFCHVNLAKVLRRFQGDSYWFPFAGLLVVENVLIANAQFRLSSSSSFLTKFHQFFRADLVFSFWCCFCCCRG